MRYETNLASKALSPSVVRDEPKIHTCRNPEVKSDEENKENSVVNRLFRNNRNAYRGDILIRDLWARLHHLCSDYGCR
jgi:hypothetical protein